MEMAFILVFTSLVLSVLMVFYVSIKVMKKLYYGTLLLRNSRSYLAAHLVMKLLIGSPNFIFMDMVMIVLKMTIR